MTKIVLITGLLMAVIAILMALIPHPVARFIATAFVVFSGLSAVILLILLYGGPIYL